MNSGIYKFIDRRMFDTGKTLAIFALLGVAVLEPIWLAQTYKQRERIVVLNGAGSYSVAPALTFDEATDLHEDCAYQAARAAMTRGPRGPVRSGEIDRWFLDDPNSGGGVGCRAKLLKVIDTESQEFSAKSFFQQMNITEPARVVVISDKVVTVTLTGQLIRAGVFQNRQHVEPRKFSLQLTLVRNPNMMLNNRPPLAVWDFDYQIQ
jgi:hypothetical protein